jgi:hypothetical protein
VRITGEPSAYCWDASSIYYSGPDKYTIRALPADAIASSLPAPSPPAPAPPSEKCVEAKTALGKDADVIKKLKKSIAGSTGSKQHRLRVKLKKLRKDFAGANDAAGKYC